MAEDSTEEELLGLIEDVSTGRNKCFLCGCILNRKNDTKEHIFPQWLIKQFELESSNLGLLNRDYASYTDRGFRIPCCNNCNSNLLNDIEFRVRKHVLGGYNEFMHINRLILFQWLAKIYYSTMIIELDYHSGRFKPERNYDEEFRTYLLHKTTTLKFHLKSIIHPIIFSTEPYSIIIVKTHVYDEPYMNFDFLTCPGSFFALGLRMGDIGVLACLEDNNRVERLMRSNIESSIASHPLHPTQFRELAARLFYQASRFENLSHYITFRSNCNDDIIHTPIPSYTEILSPYDISLESKYIAYRLGREITDIIPEPGVQWTSLRAPDGSFLEVEPYSEFTFGDYQFDTL